MKWLYILDASGHWIETQYVADDYVVGSQSEQGTFVQPTVGLLDPKFVDGVWTGSTQSEYNAEHPEPETKPSAQEQLNAQILLQLAQQQSTQSAFNAQILLQIAQNKEVTTNV